MPQIRPGVPVSTPPIWWESEVRSAGFAIVSRDDYFIDNPDEESTR